MGPRPRHQLLGRRRSRRGGPADARISATQSDSNICRRSGRGIATEFKRRHLRASRRARENSPTTCSLSSAELRGPRRLAAGPPCADNRCPATVLPCRRYEVSSASDGSVPIRLTHSQRKLAAELLPPVGESAGIGFTTLHVCALHSSGAHRPGPDASLSRRRS